MRRVVKKVTGSARHYQIDVEIEPSLFAKFFGATNRTYTYQGSGTVWHQFPSGVRASTWMESFLCDAVVAHKMHNEVMTAA